MNTCKFNKLRNPLMETLSVNETQQNRTVRNSDYLNDYLYVERKGGAATNAVNQVLQEDLGDRHKMNKNKEIVPCLNQMTNLIALMEQQCIDEALM